jgi:hypothetical protein
VLVFVLSLPFWHWAGRAFAGVDCLVATLWRFPLTSGGELQIVAPFRFSNGWKMALKRWLYRGGRPNRLTKIINAGWAFVHSLGIAPNYLVTLEVVGRQSGKIISFPLAMTVIHGERYLVSMLGDETNWVRNIRAAEGKARLRHGSSEQVILHELDAGRRAPVLKAFLQRAPGARPHIPVSKDAPLVEFEKIAAQYPVFRLETLE